MLLEGAVSGIAQNDHFGDGAAIWRELERRLSAVSEEQGEMLRGELDNIRMGQGEDFDVYATRVESLAEQVCESKVHYSRDSQQRALIRGIPDRFENVREMLLFGKLGEYETVKDQLRALILNDRERPAKVFACSSSSSSSTCGSSNAGSTTSASSSSSDSEPESGSE